MSYDDREKVHREVRDAVVRHVHERGPIECADAGVNATVFSHELLNLIGWEMAGLDVNQRADLGLSVLHSLACNLHAGILRASAHSTDLQRVIEVYDQIKDIVEHERQQLKDQPIRRDPPTLTIVPKEGERGGG